MVNWEIVNSIQKLSSKKTIFVEIFVMVFISNSICRLIGRETYCSNIVLRMFHSIDTVTASHYPQAELSAESKKKECQKKP